VRHIFFKSFFYLASLLINIKIVKNYFWFRNKLLIIKIWINLIATHFNIRDEISLWIDILNARIHLEFSWFSKIILQNWTIRQLTLRSYHPVLILEIRAITHLQRQLLHVLLLRWQNTWRPFIFRLDIIFNYWFDILNILSYHKERWLQVHHHCLFNFIYKYIYTDLIFI
jgi:hypothetical protein